MHILVVNCGSSSIKASVVSHTDGEHVADLKIERLGTDGAQARVNGGEPTACPSTHEAALEELRAARSHSRRN